MKTVIVLAIVAILTGTRGFLIKVPSGITQSKIAPVGWIHHQKLMLPLFENVCEDSSNPIIVRLAQEFNLDSSTGIYLKPEAIVNLKNLKLEKGLLSKGEIFTEYNSDHINELRLLYEVFFYAKDFDTFYTAAAWARQTVNCGLFVDAVYLAILNRRDTEDLTVPAPYEVLPNYFIRSDVIIRASKLQSGEEITPLNNIREEGNAYILDNNYTVNLYDNDDESKLTYFYEDIGLNTYYFLQKLKNAPWFNSPRDMNIRYGEYLYHTMKQLTTRYDLERYSNSLPEIETINLNTFKLTPYNPMLIYSNGNEFCERSTSFELPNDKYKELLQNIENNVMTVVNDMVGSGYNKTQILNHLVEILVTSENSYENVVRKLTGKDLTSPIGQTSVLDHYMTSMRDPAFWKLNKKIVNLIDDSLKTVPSYTRNELYFPGIEILNIDIKKMATNFDYFQIEVTDALKSTTSRGAFQVKIEQSRLNHKPFTVKLNIFSAVTQKGLVKIYLGPKTAPGEFALKKNMFMLMDRFEYNFKKGTNVVSRSSHDMEDLSEDFTPLRAIRKNVEEMEFGLDSFQLRTARSVTGFPSRLILPKGSPDGLPIQLFVIVTPFVKVTGSGLYVLPGTEFNSAVLSPGFPLDLNIDGLIFDLPNVMLKDCIITHKDNKVSNYGGIGITEKWQNSGSYDPSARPDYASKRKEPFDYSAKKGQYGKKDDYSAKRGTYYKDNMKTIDQTQNPLSANQERDDKLFEKVHLIKDTNKNQNVDEIGYTRISPETNYKDQITADTLKDIPQLKQTAVRKRIPSIFDYILPKYYDYYDNTHDKDVEIYT